MTFTMGGQPLNFVEYNQWQKPKMAYIQCGLSGIASSWFLRLQESYKKDWSAFFSAFKKLFSPQETAYYGQVENQALLIKQTKSKPHCALKIQQFVVKSWCNESAATFNLKLKEIITRGLPKQTGKFCSRTAS